MGRKGIAKEGNIKRLLHTLNEHQPSTVRTVMRRLNENTLNSRPIPAEIGSKIDEMYDKYSVTGFDETAAVIRRVLSNVKDILDAVDSERVRY